VPRCLALVGTLAVLTLGLAVTGGAHAGGLGRLNVQSALGQPLRAEVEVPSVGQDEAATLQLRLAPQSAFRQANLEFNPALTQLRFDLEAHSDGNVVPLANDGYARTVHRFEKAGHYVVRVERTNRHGYTAVGHLQVRVGVE